MLMHLNVVTGDLSLKNGCVQRLSWAPTRFHEEPFTLNSAVAGLKMAHLSKITLSFEFSVLTLTVL